MRKHLYKPMFAILLALGVGIVGEAQEEKPAPRPQAKLSEIIPLKVQVVISRYQGEKKVSSLPYTLSVNANENNPFAQSSLRMGGQIPVPVMGSPTVDGKPVPGLVQGAGPVQYKDVGTNIDCRATTTADGRFNLWITIEDTSVYTDDQGSQDPSKPRGVPSFRSFRSNNTVLLKDGQSTQFIAATDRISGETIRVDVTINVAK